MTTIMLTHPWNNKTVIHDISGLTERQLQSLPLNEYVCNDLVLTHLTSKPEEFLSAYVQKVGPLAAGAVLYSVAANS